MTKQEQRFVETVWDFYRTNKRTHLPWRQTTDPYCVLVSELMLQQTQVDRVIPKYEAFINKWPTVHTLSAARLGEVLGAWQGLGYNRRAKYLHAAATVICDQYDGQFPTTFKELVSLPGVGPYTAGAVCVFAYNQPVPLIETNIRTVFIYQFYRKGDSVSDAELLHMIQRTLPTDSPRDWYAALMDYGSYLKQVGKCQNCKSRSYRKQSPFRGSDREIRGAILRQLAGTDQPIEIVTLMAQLSGFASARTQKQILSLAADGLVVVEKTAIRLP